jgi:hypothetical protein
MMIPKENHEMRLETVHPSGAEEWLCPECGRRFVAQWEPKFRRVILERGQENVSHQGQAINLLEDISAAPDDNDPGLQDVWKELLDKLDFDSNGDLDLDKSP